MEPLENSPTKRDLDLEEMWDSDGAILDEIHAIVRAGRAYLTYKARHLNTSYANRLHKELDDALAAAEADFHDRAHDDTQAMHSMMEDGE